MAGDTAGHSINVHGVTGGSVTFGTGTAGTTTDNNQGFLITGNSGGTITVAGTANKIDTTGPLNDAVTITNNTGATINMGPLAITTTKGAGPIAPAAFIATGGGTLNVTGLTNTVSRDDTGDALGTAITIDGMTIGAVDFKSVNVTGGQNGVRLVNNNSTAGVISIGSPGNTAGQGGTITQTGGAGVYAEDSNVVVNGVNLTNAGTGTNDSAVQITHTNGST